MLWKGSKSVFEDVSDKTRETSAFLGTVSTGGSSLALVRLVQSSQTSPPCFCSVFDFACACVQGLVLAPFQHGEWNSSG